MTTPLTPEQRKGLEAVVKLLDKPLIHNCENCGTEAMGPASGLPIGWRWFAMGERWDSVEDVDDDTKLLCSFCVARVVHTLAESKTCGKK